MKVSAMTGLPLDSFLGAGERGTIENGEERADPGVTNNRDRVPPEPTKVKEKKCQRTKSTGTEGRDPKWQSSAVAQGTSSAGWRDFPGIHGSN